jgi:DNA repair protein RecO (recombination protein O)
VATTKGPRAVAAPLAAYVLHSYDFSESSLIVELFTRTQGRVVAMAKGAKRPTSNFRPVLLPFHALSVWLSKPAADDQGEVRTLRAAEWGGGEPLPAAALMSGFYVNELLLKGLPRQDPHPVLFDAYAATLVALARSVAAAAGSAAAAPLGDAPALRAFELRLLQELGWLPALDTETATAQPLRAGVSYALLAEGGLAEQRAGLPADAWIGLHAALEHGSPLALAQACSGLAAALRTPLRESLQYHLATSHLRTRRIGLELQRLASSRLR